MSLKGDYEVDTRLSALGELAFQYLVVYGDNLDPTLPMRLIYVSRIGPVSAEYRVDAYYR